jgi:hypothetical protein
VCPAIKVFFTPLFTSCVTKKKKTKYVDRRVFHPLPAPSPIRYSPGKGPTARPLNISEISVPFSIPIGVAKAAGRSPGRVIKFWNTRKIKKMIFS